MIERSFGIHNRSTEKIIFFLVVLINLIPVLSFKYFPTLDGPSHLFNAEIINELIFNKSSELKSYFLINNQIVPNWTGHLILSSLMRFLPAFIAEKVLLAFYLGGLPFIFRGFVKSINGNQLFSYLIFPFCYTSVFLLGFYNFSIGILFMFLCFKMWFKLKGNKFSIKNIIQFIAIFIIIYFSHLVVFLITVGVIIGEIIFSSLVNSSFSKWRHEIKTTLHELGFVITSAAIPSLFFIQYFFNRNNIQNSKKLPLVELNEGLLSIKSLIGFNYELERSHTFYILCGIILLLSFIFYKRFETFFNKKTSVKPILKRSDFWLITAIGVLVLYYVLPNEGGSAGFISIRLNLFFYLFLLCWIISEPIPKSLVVTVAIIFCVSNFYLISYYTSVTKDLNKIISQIEGAASYIEAESTVLPLNYSNNWLTSHFSNYLGVNKPIIVLENYEATLDYFPIKWNAEKYPNIGIDSVSVLNPECISWISNPYGKKSVADYVFILGNSLETDCSILLNESIELNYQTIYLSGDVKLLKHI